jgi:peptide/nickel transport system permease protein
MMRWFFMLDRLLKRKGRGRHTLDEIRYALYLVRRSPLTIFGTILILIYVFMALAGPMLAPYDPIKVDFAGRLQSPNIEHPFGTDDIGRDILSRVLYGANISLQVAIVVVSASFLIGTAVGITAGYFGGRVDSVFMRISEVFLSIPSLVLALAITSVLGGGLLMAEIGIILTRWPWNARMIRSEVLKVKQETYIEASRSYGSTSLQTIWRHVLPNSITPVIIQATAQLGGTILLAAGLSFLGVGAQEPTPEWGLMITTGRYLLTSAWWVPTIPGLVMFISVLGFNLLGDGLRDILDPRMRHG